MNPAAILLGIAVLTVAGGIAYAALSPSRFLKSSDRIWLFGDSIGVGLLPRLKQQATVPVDGNPIGGTTIQRWAGDDASIHAAREWGATVALVVLGTNDAAGGPEYRTHVRPLAATFDAKLRAAGMRVWWLGPGAVPKWPSQGTEVQAAIRSALAGGDSVVADPSNLSIRKPDGVHPDGAGYSTLADWILGRMAH